MNQLEDLLQQCAVKLTLPDRIRWGTGFFVASEWILTCAHVVQEAKGQPIQVRWQNQENWAQAVVERSLSEPYDLALLRVTRSSEARPPCVYLDEVIQSRDPLYLFGYPDQDFPNGCPVTFSYEGLTGDEPALIKFALGQVRPGMSGSPLLNQRTGKVCGIVKFTRDRSIDLGGGAVPTTVILAQFPELVEQQRDFHQRDRRWSQRIEAVSESIRVNLPQNVVEEMEVEVHVNQHKYNGELVFIELKFSSELGIVENSKIGIRLSITFGEVEEKISKNNGGFLSRTNDGYIRFGIKHGKLRLNLKSGSIPLEQREPTEELNEEWLIRTTGVDEWLIRTTGVNESPVWEFQARDTPTLQGMRVNKKLGVVDLLGTYCIVEATFNVIPSRTDIQIIDADGMWDIDTRPNKRETIIAALFKYVIKPKVKDYLSKVVLQYGS